jgi:hypothetical protein
MHIKKGTPCELTVLVTDALGRPAADVGVAFAYPDYPHFYLEREPTDKNGRGHLFFVGPGVFVRAESRVSDELALESNVQEIGLCPTETVVLKLDKQVKLSQ